MSEATKRCIDPRPASREEELALLAGGDLAPDEAARLEEHAGRCPACRELLDGLRASVAGLAALAEADLGPANPADEAALERVRSGVRDGVTRIEAAREAAAPSARPVRWALAAALLVALLAAAVWLRSGGRLGPEPEIDEAGDRIAAGRAPETRPAAPGDPRSPETIPGAAAGETADRRTAPPVDRAPDRASDPGGGSPAGAPPEIARTEPLPAPGPDRGRTPDPRPHIENRPLTAGPPEGRPAEPRITIRIVSDDPDIVFYWLVEPEENRDETVSS